MATFRSSNTSTQSNTLLWCVAIVMMLCIMQAPTVDALSRRAFPAPNSGPRRQYVRLSNLTRTATLPLPLPATLTLARNNGTSVDIKMTLPRIEGNAPQAVFWLLQMGSADRGDIPTPTPKQLKRLALCYYLQQPYCATGAGAGQIQAHMTLRGGVTILRNRSHTLLMNFRALSIATSYTLFTLNSRIPYYGTNAFQQMFPDQAFLKMYDLRNYTRDAPTINKLAFTTQDRTAPAILSLTALTQTQIDGLNSKMIGALVVTSEPATVYCVGVHPGRYTADSEAASATIPRLSTLGRPKNLQTGVKDKVLFTGSVVTTRATPLTVKGGFTYSDISTSAIVTLNFLAAMTSEPSYKIDMYQNWKIICEAEDFAGDRAGPKNYISPTATVTSTNKNEYPPRFNMSSLKITTTQNSIKFTGIMLGQGDVYAYAIPLNQENANPRPTTYAVFKNRVLNASANVWSGLKASVGVKDLRIIRSVYSSDESTFSGSPRDRTYQAYQVDALITGLLPNTQYRLMIWGALTTQPWIQTLLSQQPTKVFEAVVPVQTVLSSPTTPSGTYSYKLLNTFYSQTFLSTEAPEFIVYTSKVSVPGSITVLKFGKLRTCQSNSFLCRNDLPFTQRSLSRLQSTGFDLRVRLNMPGRVSYYCRTLTNPAMYNEKYLSLRFVLGGYNTTDRNRLFPIVRNERVRKEAGQYGNITYDFMTHKNNLDKIVRVRNLKPSTAYRCYSIYFDIQSGKQYSFKQTLTTFFNKNASSSNATFSFTTPAIDVTPPVISWTWVKPNSTVQSSYSRRDLRISLNEKGVAAFVLGPGPSTTLRTTAHNFFVRTSYSCTEAVCGQANTPTFRKILPSELDVMNLYYGIPSMSPLTGHEMFNTGSGAYTGLDATGNNGWDGLLKSTMVSSAGWEPANTTGLVLCDEEDDINGGYGCRIVALGDGVSKWNSTFLNAPRDRSIRIGGLEQRTEYRLYIWAQDFEGNAVTKLTEVYFNTTSYIPLNVDGFNIRQIKSLSASFNVSATRPALFYWTVVSIPQWKKVSVQFVNQKAMAAAARSSQTAAFGTTDTSVVDAGIYSFFRNPHDPSSTYAPGLKHHDDGAPFRFIPIKGLIMDTKYMACMFVRDIDLQNNIIGDERANGIKPTMYCRNFTTLGPIQGVLHMSVTRTYTDSPAGDTFDVDEITFAKGFTVKLRVKKPSPDSDQTQAWNTTTTTAAAVRALLTVSTSDSVNPKGLANKANKLTLTTTTAITIGGTADAANGIDAGNELSVTFPTYSGINVDWRRKETVCFNTFTGSLFVNRGQPTASPGYNGGCFNIVPASSTGTTTVVSIVDGASATTLREHNIRRQRMVLQHALVLETWASLVNGSTFCGKGSFPTCITQAQFVAMWTATSTDATSQTRCQAILPYILNSTKLKAVPNQARSAIVQELQPYYNLYLAQPCTITFTPSGALTESGLAVNALSVQILPAVRNIIFEASRNGALLPIVNNAYEVDDKVIANISATNATVNVTLRWTLTTATTDERDWFASLDASQYITLLTSVSTTSTNTLGLGNAAIRNAIINPAMCKIVGVATSAYQFGPQGNQSLECNISSTRMYTLATTSEEWTFSTASMQASWFNSTVLPTPLGPFMIRVKKTAPIVTISPSNVTEMDIRNSVKITLEIFGDSWLSTFPGPVPNMLFASDIPVASNPAGWAFNNPNGVPGVGTFQAISLDGAAVVVDAASSNTKLYVTLNSRIYDTVTKETLSISLLAAATVGGGLLQTPVTFTILPSNGLMTMVGFGTAITEKDFRASGGKVTLTLVAETWLSAGLPACVQSSVLVVAPQNDVSSNAGGFTAKKPLMLPADASHFVTVNPNTVLVSIDPLLDYNTLGNETIYFDLTLLSACTASKLLLNFSNGALQSASNDRPQFVVADGVGQVAWLFPIPLTTRPSVVRMTEADIRNGVTMKFKVYGDTWQSNLVWISPVMFSGPTAFSTNLTQITSVDGSELTIILNAIPTFNINVTQTLTIVFPPSGVKSGAAPTPTINGATTLIAKITSVTSVVTLTKPALGGTPFTVSCQFSGSGWTGGLDLTTDPAGSEGPVSLTPTGTILLQARNAQGTVVSPLIPASATSVAAASTVTFTDVSFADDFLPDTYTVGCFSSALNEFLTSDVPSTVSPNYVSELTYPTSVLTTDTFSIGVKITHAGSVPRANISVTLVGPVNGTLSAVAQQGAVTFSNLMALNGTKGLQQFSVQISNGRYVAVKNFSLAIQDAGSPAYQLSGSVSLDIPFSFVLLNTKPGSSVSIFASSNGTSSPSCSGALLYKSANLDVSFVLATITSSVASNLSLPLQAIACYGDVLLSAGASFPVSAKPVDSVVVLSPLSAGKQATIRVTPANGTGSMSVVLSTAVGVCSLTSQFLPLDNVVPLVSSDGTFTFGVSLLASAGQVYACYSLNNGPYIQIATAIPVTGAPPVPIILPTSMSTGIAFSITVNSTVSSSSLLGVFLSASSCDVAVADPTKTVALIGGVNPITGANGIFSLTVQNRLLSNVIFCFKYDTQSPWRATFQQGNEAIITFTVKVPPSFSYTPTFPKDQLTLSLQLPGDVTSIVKIFLTTAPNCQEPAAADRTKNTAVYSGLQSSATVSGINFANNVLRFTLIAADSFTVAAQNVRVCYTMDYNNVAFTSLPNSIGGDVFNLVSRPAVVASISYSGVSPCSLELAPSKAVPALTVKMLDVNGDVAEGATNTIVISAYNSTTAPFASVPLFGTTSVTLTTTNKGVFTFNNLFIGNPDNRTVFFAANVTGINVDGLGRDISCVATIASRGSVRASGSVFIQGSNVLPTASSSYVDISISADTFNTTSITTSALVDAIVQVDASNNQVGTGRNLISSVTSVTSTSFRVIIDQGYRPNGVESWAVRIPGSLTTSKLNPLVEGTASFTIVGRLSITSIPAALTERDIATGTAQILITIADAPQNNALVDGITFSSAASTFVSTVATDSARSSISRSNWATVSSTALPASKIVRRTSSQIAITFAPSSFSVDADDSFVLVVPREMLNNYPFTLTTRVNITDSPALKSLTATAALSTVTSGQPIIINVLAIDTLNGTFPLNGLLNVYTTVPLPAISGNTLLNGIATLNFSVGNLGSYNITIEQAESNTRAIVSLNVVNGPPASIVSVIAPPASTAANASFDVSFRVQDISGNPSTGVNVSFNGAAAISDSNGLVKFSGINFLVLGSYTLVASLPSFPQVSPRSFVVVVSDTFLSVQVPNTATINDTVPITLRGQLGGNVSGITVVVTISKDKSVLTPLSAVFDNVGATLSFVPATSGVYSLQAVSSGLPLAQTQIVVLAGPPTVIRISSRPQQSGFSLNDKLIFGIELVDGTGALSSASGRINVAIASGPVGGQLRGVSAIFAANGVALTSLLQVTTLGTYQLQFCLDNTTLCTSTQISVLIPEVQLVVANGGTFSSCVGLSVTATYPTVNLKDLTVSWTVSNADGSALAVPAGWVVGATIPVGDANRLGAIITQAAADASLIYTTTSTSFSFDTTISPITFDILVGLNVTITSSGVSSSKVVYSVAKFSTVGNNIDSVVIVGTAGSTTSAYPSVFTLDSVQPLSLKSSSVAPCGATEYLWTCSRYAAPGANPTSCLVYTANTNSVSAFVSSSTSEVNIEAGSLPGLPAYYEFKLSARAKGASTYTVSSALQYAVQPKPLLAQMNISSVPLSLNSAIYASCISDTQALSRDPSDPPSVLGCTGCSSSWVYSGTAANLVVSQDGRTAAITPSAVGSFDLSCIITKDSRTAYTNVTLTVLNQVVPSFTVTVVNGVLIGQSPTELLQLGAVFGTTSGIGPLPAPYTSIAWSAVDQLGRVVRVADPTGALLAQVRSDVLTPATIPAGSLGSDVTSIAVLCTATPTSGSPITVRTNISITQPPVFVPSGITLFYLESSSATAVPLTSTVGAGTGFVRISCQNCFTGTPIDYRVLSVDDSVNDPTYQVIAGTDENGRPRGSEGSYFPASSQWIFTFPVSEEPVTTVLQVCGRVSSPSQMIEACGTITTKLVIVQASSQEIRLRNLIRSIQQSTDSQLSMSTFSRLIALSRTLRVTILFNPDANTITAQNALLTASDLVANELAIRSSRIVVVSRKNVDVAFQLGILFGRALEGSTGMLPSTHANLLTVMNRILNAVRQLSSYRWPSFYMKSLLRAWGVLTGMLDQLKSLARPTSSARHLLTTAAQQSQLNQLANLLSMMTSGLSVGEQKTSLTSDTTLFADREQVKNFGTTTIAGWTLTKQSSFPASITADTTSVADLTIAAFGNSSNIRSGPAIPSTIGAGIHVTFNAVSGTYTASSSNDFVITTAPMAAVNAFNASVTPECYTWNSDLRTYVRANLGSASSVTKQSCVMKATLAKTNEFVFVAPHPNDQSTISCGTNILPGNRIPCTITPLVGTTPAVIPSGDLLISTSLSSFLGAPLPTGASVAAPFTFYLTAPSAVGTQQIGALVGKQHMAGSPFNVVVSTQQVSGSYFTCTRRSVQSTCNPIDNCRTRSTMSFNCTIIVQNVNKASSGACIEGTFCAGNPSHPGTFAVSITDQGGNSRASDVVYFVNADQTVKTPMNLRGSNYNTGTSDASNQTTAITFTVNGPMKGYSGTSMFITVTVKGDANTVIQYRGGAGFDNKATIGVRDRIPDSTSVLSCSRSYSAGTWANGGDSGKQLAVSSPAIGAASMRTLPLTALVGVNTSITCTVSPQDASGFIAGLATDFEPNMLVSGDNLGVGFYTSQAVVFGTSPAGCSCVIGDPACACTLAQSSDTYSFSFVARPYLSGGVRNRPHVLNVLVNAEEMSNMKVSFNLGFSDFLSASLSVVSDCLGSDGSDAANTAVSNRAAKCAFYVVDATSNRVHPLNPSCVSFAGTTGHFTSSTVALDASGYGVLFDATVSPVGSCGANNQCTFALTIQSSSCGTAITSTSRFITVQHGLPTAASQVTCSGGLTGSNVRVGGSATCTILPRDAFGTITCCRGAGFSVSTGSLALSTDNTQLTSTYTVPSTIPAGTNNNDYGLAVVTATLAGTTTAIAGSPFNTYIIDYPNENSSISCGSGSVSTLQTIQCAISVYKDGNPTTADPLDFVAAYTAADGLVSQVSSIVAQGSNDTPLKRPNSVMLFTVTAGKKTGSANVITRTRVIRAAPTTVATVAAVTTNTSYALLRGSSTITVQYGVPTTASSLSCTTDSNGIDALQAVGCSITVRNAIGLTTADPTKASPFAAAFGPSLATQNPSFATLDDGATWNFNLTATQEYVLGMSVGIDATLGGVNITGSRSGPYTIVGRPTAAQTTLLCTSTTVRTLKSTTCTITPLNGKGATRSLASNFQVIPSSGSVSSLTSVNDGQSVTFSYKAAATAQQITPALQLYVSGTAGVSLPITVQPGTPTTKSNLTCTSQLGSNAVELYNAMTCTISVNDDEGPTAVAPNSFTIATSPANEGSVPSVLSLANTANDGLTYTFTYTASTSAPGIINLQVTLASSQQRLPDYPVTVSYGTPNSNSILSCAQSSIRAGQSTTCTITSRNSNGQTTAAPGTFSVVSTNGDVTALVSNRNGQTFTFTFTSTIDRPGILTLKLGATTIQTLTINVAATPTPAPPTPAPTQVATFTATILTVSGSTTYAASAGTVLRFITVPAGLSVTAVWSVQGATAQGSVTDTALQIAGQSTGGQVTVSLTLKSAGYSDFTTTITLRASSGPTGGSIKAVTDANNSWTLTCSGWSTDAVEFEFVRYSGSNPTVVRRSSSSVLALGVLIRSISTTVSETWGCRAIDNAGVSSNIDSTALSIKPYQVDQDKRDAAASNILSGVANVSSTWSADDVNNFLSSLSTATDSITILATSSTLSSSVASLADKLVAASSISSLSNSAKAKLAPAVIGVALSLAKADPSANSKVLQAANNIVVPPMDSSVAQSVLALVTATLPAAASSRRTDDVVTVSQQLAAKSVHAVVAADNWALGATFVLSSTSSPITLTGVKNVESRLARTYTTESVVLTRPTAASASDILVAVYGSVKPSRRAGALSSSILFAVADLTQFLTYTGSSYSVDMSALSAQGVAARWNTDSDSFTACTGGKTATCSGMSSVAPSEYALVVSQTSAPVTSAPPVTVTPPVTPAPPIIAPVATPSPPSDELSDRDKALLGGLLGGGGGLILIGVIVFCVMRNRKTQAPAANPEEGSGQAHAASDAVAAAQGQA